MDYAESDILTEVDRAHIKPAVETLSRAFQSYPLIEYFYPEASQRDRVSHYFFEVAVCYAARYGVVHTVSPQSEGIAVWLPPGGFPMTFGRMLRAVPLSVLIGFVRAGAGTMYAAGEYLDNMHKRLTPYKHWYLEAIGVTPEHQGKDFAGTLIRNMLVKVDEERLPCYLETVEEKNVGIYRRFGFEVIETSQVPDTPLFTWAMLREGKRAPII
jgi:ribosomal protein S18 acetylase RimI-like enzyme